MFCPDGLNIPRGVGGSDRSAPQLGELGREVPAVGVKPDLLDDPVSQFLPVLRRRFIESLVPEATLGAREQKSNRYRSMLEGRSRYWQRRL